MWNNSKFSVFPVPQSALSAFETEAGKGSPSMINDVKIARQPQWQMITYSCLTILFVMLVVHPTAAQAISPPDPVVAVHVSEITDGFVAQWPYSSWNYRSLYVTLEESLKSDGIPFVEVSDSTIAAGGLRRTSGEPKVSNRHQLGFRGSRR